MRYLRSTLSVLLCAVLLLAFFTPVASAAATSGTYGDLSWSYSSGTLTISGSGYMKEPEWTDGDEEPVSDIPWQTYFNNIKTLIVNSGVKSINGAVASGYLTKVTLPNTLERIDEGTFAEEESLTSITLPSGLRYIGEGAFEWSGLKSITIPAGVEEIPAETFFGCEQLTSVTLNTGLKSIGEFAFNTCTTLATINLPDGLEYIGPSAFEDCAFTKITIPGSVKTIDEYAFLYCSKLTSVTLQEGLETIGNYAFSDCTSKNFKTITIPSTVRSIGKDIFDSCTYLTSIHVHEGSYAATSWTGYSKKRVVDAHSYSDGHCSVCGVWNGRLDVTISQSTATLDLAMADTLQLSVSTVPSACSDLIWSSYNEAVATVSSTGLVTPVSVGTATIQCQAIYNTATMIVICTVNVIRTVPVSGITLNTTSAQINMATDGPLTLTATVLPSDASNKAVSWTSSNTSVATVSSSGVVTAKGVGSATITCTAQDGSGKSASCAVTVVRIVPVSGVTLNKTSGRINVATGETLALTATVLPSDAANKAVTWTSSDTSVATVSASGLVAPVKEGNATITVTTQDGSFRATCAVEVYKYIAATSLSLDRNAATVALGETLTLKPTILPDDATNKAVTWASSNNSVATVSSSGVVTPVATGSATISCTAQDGGFTASCAVTVVPKPIPVTSVTLSDTALSLYEDSDPVRLSATILPADATNQELLWTSGNTSVATVAQDGTVTPVGKGSTTITAAAQDGSGKSASCTVSVGSKVPVSSITLSKTSASVDMAIQTTYQLTATALPSNATNKAVTWTSSNAAVATVDANGLVTLRSVGTATIRVSAVKSSAYAECALEVFKTVPVSSVMLNKTSATLNLETAQTLQLSATVLPYDASNRNVTWTSDNTAVATVSESGLVTPVAVGTANISCTAQDGSGKKAVCAVKVVMGLPVTGLKLNSNNETLTLGSDWKFYLYARVEPENASDDTVWWTSSNESVANVTEDGVVYPMGVGTATITAISNENPDIEASCKITVKKGSNVKASGDFSEYGNNMCWVLENDGTLHINGFGCTAAYEEADGMKRYNTSIKEITIHEGVTTINYDAFAGLNKFTSVSVPTTLKSIRDHAFDSCSAMRYIPMLPDDLTSIGEYAFKGCTSLQSIRIPAGVSAIGRATFADCTALWDVKLPNTLKTIGVMAFDNCTALETINIPNGVTTIDNYAFDGTSLKSVDIPASVTLIGNYAFSNCEQLEEVSLPAGLTRLCPGAFDHCKVLKSVELPDSLSSIENNAFSYCTALTSVKLPAALTGIGDYAFNYCTALTSIALPATLTEIGKYAFSSCSGIKSVSIPAGVTAIEERTFYNCTALESVDLPEGLTSIGVLAFYGTRLKNVDIPASVSVIQKEAFEMSGLTSLTLPVGVREIGANAFFGCSDLANVSIPYTVTSIGGDAFYGCRNIAQMNVHEDSCAHRSLTSFGSVKLVEPHNYVNNICSICGWERKVETVTLNVETAALHAVQREKFALVPQTAPAEAVNHAVVYASSNEAVAVVDENGVITALSVGSAKITCTAADGGGAKAECLVTVTAHYAEQLNMPKGLKRIESEAFAGMSFEEAQLGDTVSYIGSKAFANNEALRAVIIPASVTTIEDDAFADCPNVTLVLPAGSAWAAYAAQRGIAYVEIG